MWSGCGGVVTSNEIFDAPCIGIMMEGHGVLYTFEGNHLHDLAQGVADSSGFYSGRTWSDRGNIVRHNRFRRFYATERLAQNTSVNGIYLDDMESGWTIEDNVFEDIRICVFIGGGRQNLVLRNEFLNCSIPVHVDDRGLNFMKCDPNQSYPSTWLSRLNDLRYKEPP